MKLSRTVCVASMVMFFFAVPFAKAAIEPIYCNPTTFVTQLQVPIHSTGNLWRAHAFKLGDVVLVGVAVGYSDPEALMTLSKDTSTLSTRTTLQDLSQDRYCTWYLNRGRTEPEKYFNHDYVPAPYIVTKNFPGVLKDVDKHISPELDPLNLGDMIQAYKASLHDALLGSGDDSFLYCAQKYHYVAMGCNSQKQRGPTVVGSLLAFTGCKPEHALTIVDSVWTHPLVDGHGSDIQVNARLAILRSFYKWGLKNPTQSGALRALFSQAP